MMDGTRIMGPGHGCAGGSGELAWLRGKLRILGAVLTLALSAVSAPSLADGAAVGVVEDLAGTAIVIHAGATRAETLAVKTPVYLHDIIQTKPDSKVRLRFVDDTRVHLGPESTLKITRYVYAAGAQERSALLTIAEGIYRAIVSRVAGTPGFGVQTPTAVASVRGTDWLGQATADLSSAVVLEGAVAIGSSNPTVDETVVLEEGDGTSVAFGEPPAPKSRWSQERINAFRRSTSID